MDKEKNIIDFINNFENINDEFMYDSLEDIQMCLNCEKEKCTNCLKYKNGV